MFSKLTNIQQVDKYHKRKYLYCEIEKEINALNIKNQDDLDDNEEELFFDDEKERQLIRLQPDDYSKKKHLEKSSRGLKILQHSQSLGPKSGPEIDKKQN